MSQSSGNSLKILEKKDILRFHIFFGLDEGRDRSGICKWRYSNMLGAIGKVPLRNPGKAGEFPVLALFSHLSFLEIGDATLTKVTFLIKLAKMVVCHA